MYKKKLICLALAAMLPMGAQSIADEAPATAAAAPATEASAPAAVSEPLAPVEAAEPAVAETPAEKAEPASEAPSEKADPIAEARKSMDERWKEREARYEALKKRAEESGVMLPDTPPWRDRQAMQDLRPDRQERMERMKKMQAMTPEEREAYRLERYAEMRAKAEEMGVELPEAPPWKQRQNAMQEEWAKHQEVIKGMTDEERAACHAMHRRHMREAAPGPMRGMRPPMFQGYAPGYGHGPAPFGTPGEFWDPAQ